MNCEKCKRELAADHEYCPGCGARRPEEMTEQDKRCQACIRVLCRKEHLFDELEERAKDDWRAVDNKARELLTPIIRAELESECKARIAELEAQLASRPTLSTLAPETEEQEREGALRLANEFQRVTGFDLFMSWTDACCVCTEEVMLDDYRAAREMFGGMVAERDKEIAELRAWKDSAMEVMSKWDAVSKWLKDHNEVLLGAENSTAALETLSGYHASLTQLRAEVERLKATAQPTDGETFPTPAMDARSKEEGTDWEAMWAALNSGIRAIVAPLNAENARLNADNRRHKANAEMWAAKWAKATADYHGAEKDLQEAKARIRELEAAMELRNDWLPRLTINEFNDERSKQGMCVTSREETFDTWRWILKAEEAKRDRILAEAAKKGGANE